MDFRQRFKGRVSTMNKEGVLGIVKQQGQPVEKSFQPPDMFQRNMQQFFKVEDGRPAQQYQNSSPQKEHQSRVFTHIVSNRNQVKPNSSTIINSGQNVLRNHQSPDSAINLDAKPHLYHVKYTNKQMVDMNEYDIIAVPKKQPNQQIDMLSQMAHSHVITSQTQKLQNNHFGQMVDSRATTGEPDNYHVSPLIKTYSYDPKFIIPKQQNDMSYTQKHGHRKGLLQAGSNTLKDPLKQKFY